MNPELEQARREFLDECDLVVKVPGSWYLDGISSDSQSTIVPIPLYVYVGVKESQKFSIEIKYFSCKTHIGLQQVHLDDVVSEGPYTEGMEIEGSDTEMGSCEQIFKMAFINLFDDQYIDLMEHRYGEKFPPAEKEKWYNILKYKEIQGTLKRLRRSRFKIWSQIPPREEIGFYGALSTAAAIIVYCLNKGITVHKFNYQMKRYMYLVRCPNVMNLFFPSSQVAPNDIEIINDFKQIFIWAWLNNNFRPNNFLLDNISNGADCICSLIGNTIIQPITDSDTLNIISQGRSQNKPTTQEKVGLDTLGTQGILKQQDHNAISYYIPSFYEGTNRSENKHMKDFYTVSFVHDVFLNKKIKISCKYKIAKGSELLITNWEGKEQWLVGPDLEPLFFDKDSQIFSIIRAIQKDTLGGYLRRVRYNGCNLSFITSYNLLQKIQKEIKGNNVGWILYNSRGMGWRTEGVILLEGKEYKLIPLPEENKIEIDFSDKKDIKIGDKTISMKSQKGIRQEFLLLEEILNNGRGEIHWSSGFVLFKKWQNNVPKEGPVEQFRTVVSDLKSASGLPILVPLKKKEIRLWKLNETIKVEDSIRKTNILCQEARKLSDAKQIIEKSQEAFLLYPESIEASKLLINSIQKYQGILKLEGSLKDWLYDAENLLRQREENLKSAIMIIQNEGNKNGWIGDWKETKNYGWRMIEECKEIQQHRIIGEGLLKEEKVSPDEAECLALLEMINHIRGGSEDIFAKFVKHPAINKCIKVASAKFMQIAKDKKWRDINYKEIEMNAVRSLWEAFSSKRWRNPHVREISKLQNYLIAIIYFRLHGWFMQDKYEIPEEKQDDLWRLWKVRKELKKKIDANPSIDDLLKELGPKWDKSRVQEILAYEENMSGHVDINEEWKYADALGIEPKWLLDNLSYEED